MLSDHEIKSRLPDLKLTTDNPNFPFDADKQVQPCSLDIRLSQTMWIPRRFRQIDLSDNTPLGPKITKAFRKAELKNPGGYLLRPGRFILCSTYERFEIPPDLCGRLVGRSSMGRMGLTVSGGSNFINPGWAGRMPVMLVNNSPFCIRVHPYLSIVQLCLMPLSSKPENLYGDDGIGSKYTNDDGGPSRYWLDHTIKSLRENLHLKNTSPKAEAFLEAYAQDLDEPTRKRFLGFLKKSKYIEDGADFARAFVSREQRRGPITSIIGLAGTTALSNAIRFLPAAFGLGLIGWAIAVPAAVIVTGALGLGYWRQSGTTISPNELRKMINETSRKIV